MNHKELNQYRDDLHGRIIRIETILDESLPKIEKHLGRIDDKLRKQNGRIRILEDSKIKIYTVVGVVSFLTPILLKALGII
jgi:hypothetical protein|tara:strand:- start:4115 stop:4357 length:243 start_codon:yes stop_codon:yes gene_type:complete